MQQLIDTAINSNFDRLPFEPKPKHKEFHCVNSLLHLRRLDLRNGAQTAAVVSGQWSGQIKKYWQRERPILGSCGYHLADRGPIGLGFHAAKVQMMSWILDLF